MLQFQPISEEALACHDAFENVNWEGVGIQNNPQKRMKKKLGPHIHYKFQSQLVFSNIFVADPKM